MKTFSLCLVAFVTICFTSQLFAITDEEIFRSFSLNLSTPGARARAMGGAFIGRADDATAAETNPAGLTILVRPEFSFEYRYANGRTIASNIVNIPVRSCTDPTNPNTCLDLSPTPVAIPQPGTGLGDVTAEFVTSDTAEAINEIGYLSVVYPIESATFAFSRHELINTDARVSGSLTSSPFHFVEANSFEGAVNIADTNYGFSAAAKVGDIFSVGATIKASDFAFKSRIGARQKAQPLFGEHFVSNVDTDDWKVGFNAGVLVRPSAQISLGAVYRYEPKFTLDVVVDNADFGANPLIIEREGHNQVDFDVPDSLGFGVSVAPKPFWTVNLDVVRIFYSQLEDVETGFSLFTHLLPIIREANQINFKIDDGTDVHAGTEFTFNSDRWVYAARFGYYRQTRNRFFLDRAANPDIQLFLQPIFGSNPGNDVAHWTVGGGITYGQFQLDLAVDLSQKDDINFNDRQEIADPGFDFIVSSVFRF
jgi:long-subunit fatty acid transport protein